MWSVIITIPQTSFLPFRGYFRKHFITTQKHSLVMNNRQKEILSAGEQTHALIGVGGINGLGNTADFENKYLLCMISVLLQNSKVKTQPFDFCFFLTSFISS